MFKRVFEMSRIVRQIYIYYDNLIIVLLKCTPPPPPVIHLPFAPPLTSNPGSALDYYVKTTSRRRFDIIMTLLLRRVSDGKITQKWQQPTKIKRLCLIYWKSGKAADRDASEHGVWLRFHWVEYIDRRRVVDCVIHAGTDFTLICITTAP